MIWASFGWFSLVSATLHAHKNEVSRDLKILNAQVFPSVDLFSSLMIRLISR